jgi:hypothetical protein
MPPTTKEAQRAEVHKTIWRIANDLRGSADGWDFKSYVRACSSMAFLRDAATRLWKVGALSRAAPARRSYVARWTASWYRRASWMAALSSSISATANKPSCTDSLRS